MLVSKLGEVVECCELFEQSKNQKGERKGTKPHNSLRGLPEKKKEESTPPTASPTLTSFNSIQLRLRNIEEDTNNGVLSVVLCTLPRLVVKIAFAHFFPFLTRPTSNQNGHDCELKQWKINYAQHDVLKNTKEHCLPTRDTFF